MREKGFSILSAKGLSWKAEKITNYSIAVSPEERVKISRSGSEKKPKQEGRKLHPIKAEAAWNFFPREDTKQQHRQPT